MEFEVHVFHFNRLLLSFSCAFIWNDSTVSIRHISLVSLTQVCVCHQYKLVALLLLPACLSFALYIDFFFNGLLSKERTFKNPLTHYNLLSAEICLKEQVPPLPTGTVSIVLELILTRVNMADHSLPKKWKV